jgi:hypothetical protein
MTVVTSAAGRVGMAALVLVTGCVPVIAHGPRVQAGPSFGASASLTAGPVYPNGDDPTKFLYGPFGLNAGYGWASDSTDGAAVRVGLHVPVPFVIAAQPDVYFQVPRRLVGGMDAGLGLSTSFYDIEHVGMPYVQLGHINDNGSGWYTTQGYYTTQGFDTDRRPGSVVDRAWVSTVAYQLGAEYTTTHLFVTGAFGRESNSCAGFSPEVCRSDGRWSVMTGLTLDVHRQRSRTREAK